MSDFSGIKVLFIASEADPFVKVGGLADVAGSLPRALKALSGPPAVLSGGPPAVLLGDIPTTVDHKIDVRLVIPFHPQVRQQGYTLQPVAEFPIHHAAGIVEARAYYLEDAGLPVYLIAGEPIDQESGVYSADPEADGYKYVFFSLACLELARQLGWKADILHANDWHTAAAVYSLALHRSADPFFSQTASLLTVHNLPYLGSMTPPAMQAFGLPPAEHPDLPAWASHMALPLGLLGADAVVAVSPGYAREILTEEYGSGLAYFLQERSAKISGILNGLDTQKWDPARDPLLVNQYTAESLANRPGNKAFLQEKMGLEINPGVALLSMVTRLDPQKGVDLAVDALRAMLQSKQAVSQPFQMIFLGTGNPVLESEIRQLEHEFPRTICAYIGFSEQVSHYIYAGADILLMPSRYEPCGLSQMIAMHYGCVPIARATGGLYDTIQDPSESSLSTGFLFTPPKPNALVAAIRRALEVFTHDPAGWQAMQQRGMKQDFSWDRSAREYLKTYMSLLPKE